MATINTKKKHGTMPCEGSRCASHIKQIPVVVFKNERGTLSYNCHYCDRAPYAREGTEQHADWMQDLKLFVGAPVPAPAPATGKPVIAPKRGAFDMGDL